MKKISTLTGILILLVAVIILFGGVFAYQYYFDQISKNYNQSTATYKYNKTTEINQTIHNSVTWNGHWVLEGSDEISNAELDITNANTSSFQFIINAVDGGDMGQINSIDEAGTIKPTAKIKNNTALAVIKDSAFGECDINFTLINSSQISLQTNGCNSYAGNGVSFDGNYIKNGVIKQRSLSDIILSSGSNIDKPIFNNESEILAFNNLVGNANAKLFIDSLAPVFDDQKDLDNFGARVYEGFMIHNASNAAIIMIAPSNKIWAAVSDYDATNSQQLVRYFTNDSAYQNQLPKTIQFWINQNSFDKNAKVIFTYKN